VREKIERPRQLTFVSFVVALASSIGSHARVREGTVLSAHVQFFQRRREIAKLFLIR